MVRQAVRINGLTEVAITKIDVLSGLKEIPVCIAYEINGKQYDTVPASLKDYAAAKPVYKVFKGWDEDISTVSRFEDLPAACQEYVKFIEEYIGTKVALVSVSPEREGNIILHNIF